MIGGAQRKHDESCLNMDVIQRNIELAPRKRGFHLVTDEIVDQLPELGAGSRRDSCICSSATRRRR